MPDTAEVLDVVQAIVSELAAITTALRTPPPPARPDVVRCKLCPVRQLCAEYWHATETQILRTLSGAGQGSDSSPPIRDIELIHFPNDWAPGKPLSAIAEGTAIGPVNVTLPRTFCPDEGSPRPAGARLLGVLLLPQPDGLHARLISGTEVFWIAPTNHGPNKSATEINPT